MHVARNSCWEALVGCTLRSQNWVAKAVASAADRIWCSLWLHAGCCQPAVRGFLALLGRMPSHLHPVCTPRASPFACQRFLWCIGGSNSSIDKRRQQAAHTQYKTDENLSHVVNTACRPRVFQVALCKGFLNLPYIPPPPLLGHSAGTNEATKTPTPENAPCWHEAQ